MDSTTRSWLPVYCHPETLLPAVQETIVLFSRPPFLFQDFVGKAMTFLRSETVREMGFEYDPKTTLPCKWKCSDESVFGVDLILYAYTGHYPFDKGRIGGRFNEASLGAAVHHSPTNIDFGGSHVGYRPGPNGGTFGQIVRPLREQEISADCGYLTSVIEPFQQVYDDACSTIMVFSPDGKAVLVSVPNEYLQPSWSRARVKLLVEVGRLTQGIVPYDVDQPHTHKFAGRTLFYLAPELPAGAVGEEAAKYKQPKWTPIGRALTAEYFNIFDSEADLAQGVPRQRLLPYIKYILSSPVAPPALKAAVTNANIEYNILTDVIRAETYRHCSFASFTGIFIDLFDERLHAYVNLFQPIGITIKPAGRTREIEIPPARIHDLFDELELAEPVLPLAEVMGFDRPGHVLEKFTFGAGSAR